MMPPGRPINERHVSANSHLGMAIEEYRKNPQWPEITMFADALSILEASPEAERVFRELCESEWDATRILQTCLLAFDISINFKAKIDAEKQKAKDIQRFLNVLAELNKFLKDSENKKSPVDAWVREPPENLRPMLTGLAMTQSHLHSMLDVSRRNLLYRGATRKTGGDAGRTAAIGWLSWGVEAVTGSPNDDRVAQLADILFRTNEAIEPTLVREARRTRNTRRDFWALER
jgi:hypothetical protein